MAPVLSLLHIDTLIGPNIYSPHAGVFFELSAAADCSSALHLLLKDFAGAVGLVVGPPQISVTVQADDVRLRTFLLCSDAAFAADLCRDAVIELDAALRADEEFDAGEARFQLQRRRRRAAPPLHALQLIADARRHDHLARMLADGSLLLGSGCAALRIPAEALSTASRPSVDWSAVGHVPLLFVSGAARHSAAQRLAAEQQLPWLADPAPATVLAALADPACNGLVISQSADQLLHHGLPVPFCHAAIVCDAAEPCPPAVTPQAWQQAVGLPVLVSRGPVLLGAAAELRQLQPFAAHGYAAWPPAGVTCFPILPRVY